ncbi:hypothetical protein F2Q69_00010655 [Brassica cretica]|uniref:Uncharacterized protein n=1 Tax=Brassica cretica TaxID=69181 RepID=A0A8S9QTC3_BRACR|nr:hypothetical protein F2Q69_00010655 [Brassica cretica]
MSMADPPDLPPSPMKDGTSLEEAQGSEEVTTKVLEIVTIQTRGEEGDQSLQGLEEKTGNQKTQGENPARLNGSWVGAVQEKTCTREKEDLRKEQEELEEGEVKEVNSKNKEVQNKEGQVLKEIDEVEDIAANKGVTLGTEGEKTPESKSLESKSEWEDVSPGKASRSPNTRKKELEFGQVSILTKSRFSVLTPVDDGELPDHENELGEKEVEEDI